MYYLMENINFQQLYIAPVYQKEKKVKIEIIFLKELNIEKKVKIMGK